MSKAWFTSLVVLPTIIDAPGAYLTRYGEIVQVETLGRAADFGCRGSYTETLNGTTVREGWHRSGRLLFGRETRNDIVSKVAA